MSELDSLFSNERKIKIGTEEVAIKSITLGDLPIILKLASKFMDLTSNKKQDIKLVAMKMLTEDFESVLELFEVTTDLPKDKLKKLNMAASIVILSEVVKDNADFFQQHVAPALQSLSGKVSGTNKSKN